MCVFVCVFLWTCVRVCVRACVCLCVCVWVGGWVRGKVLKETNVSPHKVQVLSSQQTAGPSKRWTQPKGSISHVCVFKEPVPWLQRGGHASSEQRTQRSYSPSDLYSGSREKVKKPQLFLNWELWFCVERRRSETRFIVVIRFTFGLNADTACSSTKPRQCPHYAG